MRDDRLMRLGALVYDGWWIWLLTIATGYGAGSLVEWRFAHLGWASWALSIGAGVILGIVGGRLVIRWHRRCAIRRELALLEQALGEAVTSFHTFATEDPHAFWERVAQAMAAHQATQGDDDATTAQH